MAQRLLGIRSLINLSKCYQLHNYYHSFLSSEISSLRPLLTSIPAHLFTTDLPRTMHYHNCWKLEKPILTKTPWNSISYQPFQMLSAHLKRQLALTAKNCLHNQMHDERWGQHTLLIWDALISFWKQNIFVCTSYTLIEIFWRISTS